MNAVEFSLAARTELHAAADRHEREYRGRGHRFYDAVERALKVIAALPTSAPLRPGVPESLAVRRRRVPGLPLPSRSASAGRPSGSRPSHTRVGGQGTGGDGCLPRPRPVKRGLARGLGALAACFDDIIEAVGAVLKQHREELAADGGARLFQLTGSHGGRTYLVGIKQGRIGQFYPR